jgi:Leucine-rich repeat (LRR) protein
MNSFTCCFQKSHHPRQEERIESDEEFKITDETFPVESLKLLNLSNNNLSLVNGLKNLTSLEYLYINDNFL